MMKEKGQLESISEGKLEGAKEKSIEIAKKLLKQNISVHVISEATGLSLKKIENLQ